MKFPFLRPAGRTDSTPLSLPQTPDVAWYYDDCIRRFRDVYAGHLHDWHDVGTVTQDGVKSRCMATLRAAKTVCAELTQLICSEGVRISIASNYRADDGSADPVADSVRSVLDNADFEDRFPAFAERVLAEGGGAVALVASQNRRSLSLRFYDALHFIPLRWDGSVITDARFVDDLRDGDRRLCLITRHCRRDRTTTVTRTLYEVTGSGTLGRELPLSDVFAEAEAEQVFRNVSGPLFVYFAPAGANNLAPQLPLGLSVYANALDTLRSLDVAFDSLRNEFLLGKKRIIVPAAALRRVIDPETGDSVRYFDNSNGVYEALNFDESDPFRIDDQTSVLRVDEHVAAINALLNLLCMQTGLSCGSLSFADGAPKTATEVISINSKSFRTRQLHQNAFRSRIRLLVRAVCDVLRELEYIPDDADCDVNVRFADGVITDEKTNAELTIARVSAGLQSRADAVSELDGVTAAEAREKIRAIDSETVSGPSD